MADQPDEDEPGAPASEDVDSPNPEFDHLFDDPVLYPPDTRSPDELALLEDLKAYDNPEIFWDASLPQIYKLRIYSPHLPGNRTVIAAEIDGDILRDALSEVIFGLMSRAPGLPKTLERHGNKDIGEFRRDAMQEPDYPEMKQAQWKFFLRHFPKLFLSLYEIAVMSSVMATGLSFWRREPDEQLSEMENLTRSTLEGQIAKLEKMIKEIVETRSSGRPPKIETEPLPEIVKRVLLTARGMMCHARGKDAVPALKGVANNLDTNAPALGMALSRCGHPWTRIKTFLEDLPNEPTKIETE